MKKHLLDGVRKGALTEEQVEERFDKWMNEKLGKIQSKSDGLAQSAADREKARQEAELARDKARQEALSAKTAETAADSEEAAAEESTEEAAAE